MEDLASIRDKLDRVDAEIISLLVEREELVTRVGKYKIANNLPIRDLEREQKLIEEKIRLAGEKLPEDFIKELFQIIINHSCLVQEKIFKQKI